MNKIKWLNIAVMALSFFTIGAVSGCWIRGILYYVHEDLGKAIFWMTAGIAVDTCCNWFSGAMQSVASKLFADYVQGPNTKDPV